MGHHVVGDDHVGRAVPRRRRRRASSTPKNSRRVGMPAASAASAWSGRRVDAEDRDAVLDEVAQQVAVVAGQLDDEAVARRGRVARSGPGHGRGSGRAGRRRTTRSRGSCRRRAARGGTSSRIWTSEQAGQKRDVEREPRLGLVELARVGPRGRRPAASCRGRGTAAARTRRRTGKATGSGIVTAPPIGRRRASAGRCPARPTSSSSCDVRIRRKRGPVEVVERQAVGPVGTA